MGKRNVGLNIRNQNTVLFLKTPRQMVSTKRKKNNFISFDDFPVRKLSL